MAATVQRDRDGVHRGRILEGHKVQAHVGPWTVTLATHTLELVPRADLVQGRVQVIAEGVLDEALDLFLGCPVLARKTAEATAWAPLIPSGWSCVTSALFFACSRTSSSVAKAKPTGLTRMAEPLPQLL